MNFAVIFGQFIFSLNGFRQFAHIFIDFCTGYFRIDLGSGNILMPHHLAKGFNRNALRQAD